MKTDNLRQVNNGKSCREDISKSLMTHFILVAQARTLSMKLCDSKGERRLVEVKRLLDREHGIVQPSMEEKQLIQMQVIDQAERLGIRNQSGFSNGNPYSKS
jgi:hypothetical protein